MNKTKQNWEISEISRNSHCITFDNCKSGSERWVLLMSDEHWDNKECDRALLTKHHKEAVEKNAPILKIGDLFCAMQGKWDKRADQNQLREEHRGNNYLDQLVETAVDYYKPYAKQIALITPGNHEESISVRHQTNLTDRLTSELNVKKGGYWGFVRFKFVENSSHQTSKVLHYHHGYGGGGEVTRGLIDNSRTRGQYLADVYFSGHIHRRNTDENIITSLSEREEIKQNQQLFIRGGTYKNEVTGWHSTQGRAGRPLGEYWLKFMYSFTGKDRNVNTRD